ncbi:MAG: hypothetical protein IIX17_06260 [Tidjanibacter sp.]|nr:hypothetical protein [Tidjanibacter sp.]
MSTTTRTLITKSTLTGKISRLLRLLQYGDSALPIGGFSFSGGVESAVASGLLRGTGELESFLRQSLRCAALTDGIAALHAHRWAMLGNTDAIVEVDCRLYRTKLLAENRQMSLRLGSRLLQLAHSTLQSELLAEYAEKVTQGRAYATHAVVLAATLAEVGVDEQGVWSVLMAGVENMVLGAALRTMRITHIDTQRILHRTAAYIEKSYAEAVELRLDDLQSFAPMLEIVAALHERGNERLFMN